MTVQVGQCHRMDGWQLSGLWNKPGEYVLRHTVIRARGTNPFGVAGDVVRGSIDPAKALFAPVWVPGILDLPRPMLAPRVIPPHQQYRVLAADLLLVDRARLVEKPARVVVELICNRQIDN